MINENNVLNDQEVTKVDGRDAAWWKASSDRWRDCCFEIAYAQDALHEKLDELQAKLRAVEEDKGVLKDLLKETQERLQVLTKAAQKTADWLYDLKCDTKNDNGVAVGGLYWDLNSALQFADKGNGETASD